MKLAGMALLTLWVVVSDAGGTPESTILTLEKQWSVANVQKDIATLDRIMAADYVGIESIGTVATKAQEISDIKTGGVVVDAEEPTQMRVRLYGDVGVVTGRLSVQDRRNGKAGHHEVVFTDIWVKRGEQWQVVNYQATAMQDARR